MGSLHLDSNNANPHLYLETILASSPILRELEEAQNPHSKGFKDRISNLVSAETEIELAHLRQLHIVINYLLKQENEKRELLKDQIKQSEKEREDFSEALNTYENQKQEAAKLENMRETELQKHIETLKESNQILDKEIKHLTNDLMAVTETQKALQHECKALQERNQNTLLEKIDHINKVAPLYDRNGNAIDLAQNNEAKVNLMNALNQPSHIDLIRINPALCKNLNDESSLNAMTSFIAFSNDVVSELKYVFGNLKKGAESVMSEGASVLGLTGTSKNFQAICNIVLDKKASGQILKQSLKAGNNQHSIEHQIKLAQSQKALNERKLKQAAMAEAKAQENKEAEPPRHKL